MRKNRTIEATALAFALLVWPGRSHADGDSLGDSLGPREIAVGDALRASAAGGAATRINPAGAGLTRAYVLEGNYGYRAEDDATVAGASLCDSVTSQRVAACLYYDYFDASPDGGARNLSDVGLTLALPLADRLILGTTTRYVTYTESGTAAMPDNSRDGAVVVDTGLILRASPSINVALVGYNVVGGDSDNFPRGLGTGVAITPTPQLLIAVDGLWNLDAPDGEATGRYGGGAEYFVTGDEGQQGYPLRAGYVFDARNSGSYLTLGLGFMTPRVGLDAGLRKQLAGDDDGDELVVQVGLKLFFPAQ